LRRGTITGAGRLSEAQLLRAFSLAPGKRLFTPFTEDSLERGIYLQDIQDFLDCENFRDEDSLNLRTEAAAITAKPLPGFSTLQ